MAFADKKNIKTFSNKALDSTLGFVKKEEAGLFIIGLDNHVGFIHNDGQQIWFIHAKWTNPKAVVRKQQPSQVFFIIQNTALLER